jgi:hypothetical protein
MINFLIRFVMIAVIFLFCGTAFSAEVVLIKNFGAKCDGATDDTSAIQRAIDSVATSTTPTQISLPGGVCIITSSLLINRNAYLVGTGAGTIIQANYANWHSTSLAALDLDSKATTRAGVFSSMHRVFNGFTVEAVGKNLGQSTIAVLIHTSTEIQVIDAVNYAFLGGFRDVTIKNFDLGMDIYEMWNSVVDHIAMTGCRNGIRIHGKSVNVQFQHLMLTNFDTGSSSVGFSVDSGFHYVDKKEGRPEGIILSNSLIFGANNNVAVVRVLKGDVVDNILDGAVQTGVIIGSGDQVTLRNNYIYATNMSADVIQVGAVGTIVRGLNLIGNHVVASGGAGIHFMKGGAARESVVINGNRFEGSSRPIYIQTGINKSSVRDNYGNRNSGAFIYLERGGHAVIIDGNNSADAFPAVVINADAKMSLPLGHNTNDQ